MLQDNDEDMLDKSRHHIDQNSASQIVFKLNNHSIEWAWASNLLDLSTLTFEEKLREETFEIYLVIIIVNLVSHKRMWNECYFFGHMIVSQIVWTCF